MDKIIEKQLSFTKLTVRLTALGDDCHILLYGGERPHIGCTVLAVPRASLTGDGSTSATSSVLNVTGHKDEEICRFFAEKVARKRGGITVCTGGFHMDHITKEQIQEVLDAMKDIAEGLTFC